MGPVFGFGNRPSEPGFPGESNRFSSPRRWQRRDGKILENFSSPLRSQKSIWRTWAVAWESWEILARY
jgi:hypothetical protein